MKSRTPKQNEYRLKLIVGKLEEEYQWITDHIIPRIEESADRAKMPVAALQLLRLRDFAAWYIAEAIQLGNDELQSLYERFEVKCHEQLTNIKKNLSSKVLQEVENIIKQSYKKPKRIIADDFFFRLHYREKGYFLFTHIKETFGVLKAGAPNPAFLVGFIYYLLDTIDIFYKYAKVDQKGKQVVIDFRKELNDYLTANPLPPPSPTNSTTSQMQRALGFSKSILEDEKMETRLVAAESELELKHFVEIVRIPAPAKKVFRKALIIDIDKTILTSKVYDPALNIINEV